MEVVRDGRAILRVPPTDRCHRDRRGRRRRQARWPMPARSAPSRPSPAPGRLGTRRSGCQSPCTRCAASARLCRRARQALVRSRRQPQQARFPTAPAMPNRNSTAMTGYRSHRLRPRTRRRTWIDDQTARRRRPGPQPTEHVHDRDARLEDDEDEPDQSKGRRWDIRPRLWLVGEADRQHGEQQPADPPPDED